MATLSRKCRDILARAFDKSVDDDNRKFLSSRLHDFGFRGCSCLQQAMVGGSAHLLSFDGSDTMPASYYVQYALNGGKPVGTSIPASEHSGQRCRSFVPSFLALLTTAASDDFVCARA